MELSLTPEIRRLIEERMRRDGYATADEVVRAALELLDQDSDLDPETLAAIDRAEDQIARGEYREWTQASAELRKKFLGE